MIPVEGKKGLIEKIYVYGLDDSIVASGYPMKTEIDYDHVMDEKDVKRAIKLGSSKAGSGHDNFLNGIVVQFDLEITKQMWSEAQRYHWFEFVSSIGRA